MIKDSIKISQEINFNGLPTWVSVGASLLPDDNVLDCLKSLQKDITDYRDTAAKEYQQSKWKVDAEYDGNGKEIKPDPVTGMITAITTCTTIDTLKTFEKLAKSKPEFQTAYDNRLKELQP